jgi:hypothetical protein
MKVARLLALRTGRLYPQETTLVLFSDKRLSRPQGHSAAGSIMSMKNSDTIGNFFLSYLVIHCSGIGLSIVVCIVSSCMLWIFPAGKIRRLRSGANPQSWVLEASTQTPRPPKPLNRSRDLPVCSALPQPLHHRVPRNT